MENEITQLMQETRQEVASDTFWDSEIEKANLDTNSIKLLGQANMLYTQGNSVDSIKLLLTIIKANPNAPEPWLTLALNHDSNKSHRKAFGAYLIAAHLTRDPQLWKRLSLISQNDNNYPQAIYCLNKCVTCDPSDVDAIWDLAYLCYHEKRYQKAIDLYLNILQLAPFDITVTMEVVKIYKKLNHFKEAVTLLESAMEADKNHPVEIDEDEDEEPRQFRMGFKQLDILASLYIKTEEFDKAIVSIKEGVRRLQNRSTSILIARGHLEPSVNALSASSQAIADLDSDDSDLDVPEQQIPLQLRVKLEISRLRLGQVSINTHFSSFLNSDCLEKISLCFDIVEAYIKNQLYSEALDILDFLNNNDQDSKLFIMQQTAFCNHQLGDYESAIEQYKELIQLDPTNLNIKLKLAESYQECGMEDESSLLIDEIDLASKQASKKVKVKRVRKVDEYIEESEDDDDDSDDQHVILGLGKKKQDSMLTSAAKSLLIKQVDESILKMKLLEPKIDDDRIALMDYIRTCRSLISTFINTRKPLSKANLEKSIERFTNGEFQGLNIKEWYMIFINQAKLLTRTDRQDDAHETLQEAFECKVFSFSTDRKVVLKLHQLASAFQVSNFTRIAEVLRWMFIARPRAAFYGDKLTTFYASNNMNKHLHRTIKLSENNPDPLLFCLSGDTFLISRQYQLAISNYYKVFLLFPENALINLSLGISFIQYAMIRTCKNRHANIVKGFTFLYRYFDISEKSVEAHYNLARAFHFIGCLHLAVPLYEKVIANENADLKNEAAFNLSLIYYSIGNGIMAKNAINNIIV